MIAKFLSERCPSSALAYELLKKADYNDSF
jgi:hypothetical protein